MVLWRIAKPRLVQIMFISQKHLRSHVITRCFLSAKVVEFNFSRYHMQGKITQCWLAERACIKLVSLFRRSLKRNFRNASLLSLILTRSFHLNVKENQHATKHSLLMEKQKDFSEQNFHADSQPENSFEWGRLVLNETLDRTSWPPNWKLTSSFCYESPA